MPILGQRALSSPRGRIHCIVSVDLSDIAGGSFVSLVVEVALTENGIKCLRLDQTSKGKNSIQKFKNDPENLVLLLDGYESQDFP